MAGVAACLLCAGHASAAVLSLDSVVNVNTTVTTPIDLTARGTVDWAYWAPASATLLTPPVPPTNEKITATAISSLSNVGGTALRGSTTAATVERYSWSDGTPTASGTNQSLAGLIFNSALGTSANGNGLQLTVAGDPAIERIVTLYLGGFAARGNLTLTLNGATTVIDTSQNFSNSSPKQISIYTVRFEPDNISDLLTVRYTASDITDTNNSHVGMQAVTVGVPEPGSIGLGIVGVLALALRRRARNAC